MTTPERIRTAEERVRKFCGSRLPEWLSRALAGKAVDLDEWQQDFLTAWKARHGEKPEEKKP